MGTSIVLFGEAEKGAFQQGYFCENLKELAELLGNPPENSLGLYYATQAILYHYALIFFRVKEEGYSIDDYLKGVEILHKSPLIHTNKAICTPGVGNPKILNSLTDLCLAYHQLLITREQDLFDYLTS